MRDRMTLLHSVCHHHEFVKTSHRGSHETCSPQVLTEPSVLTGTEDSHAFASEAAAGLASYHVPRESFVSARTLEGYLSPEHSSIVLIYHVVLLATEWPISWQMPH
jgi:hypothetical protein